MRETVNRNRRSLVGGVRWFIKSEASVQIPDQEKFTKFCYPYLTSNCKSRNFCIKLNVHSTRSYQ